MAEQMQLDKAAAMAGKSEVTLRRLIKAGKIPYQKERTLTGFVYMVDPDQVRAYYQVREGTLLAEDALESFRQEPEPAPQEPMERVRPASQIRVAVEGESGSASDYWQKKSEAYEEKYNVEMVKHSQTREELGVWRGRAEQAHSMLMKMLPAPTDMEVRQQPESVEHRPVARKKEEPSVASLIVITILAVLLVVAVAAVVYLKFLPH